MLIIKGTSVPLEGQTNFRLPLKDKSVQCIVTSPPYWCQRIYSPDGIPDPNEFGTEDLSVYIWKWVQLTRELHRVLRDDGLFWWNHSDTASGSGGAGGDHYNDKGDKRKIPKYKQKNSDLPHRQDCNVPSRLAIAMQDAKDDRGKHLWLQRKEIIWNKNKMERCAADYVRRPKRQNERIFMFCKAGIKTVKDYKFYPDCLIEQGDIWTFGTNANTVDAGKKDFAPFPDELAARCILPSTDKGDIVFDPFSGSGTTVKVAELHGRSGVGVELYA